MQYISGSRNHHPTAHAERAFLVEQLCGRAGQLFAVDVPALSLLQPALF